MEVRSELGGKSEYQTEQSHLQSELKQKIEEAKEFLNIEEHEVKDLDSKWESDISEEDLFNDDFNLHENSQQGSDDSDKGSIYHPEKTNVQSQDAFGNFNLHTNRLLDKDHGWKTIRQCITRSGIARALSVNPKGMPNEM